jgi:catechol 2,3-dioxygenase-like lactoylglutathione lyase family enzyme
MEQVTGIGGIFLKARDPKTMSAWYRDHLGVPASEGHAEFVWREQDKPENLARTVWALFPANSGYFEGAAMVNYRVAHLDRMLAQLREAGITIDKVENYDYGRFAWLRDPEGNRIELWEPIG